jgi:hypothetical protein
MKQKFAVLDKATKCLGNVLLFIVYLSIYILALWYLDHQRDREVKKGKQDAGIFVICECAAACSLSRVVWMRRRMQ